LDQPARTRQQETNPRESSVERKAGPSLALRMTNSLEGHFRCRVIHDFPWRAEW
jgi:hypothetical protein